VSHFAASREWEEREFRPRRSLTGSWRGIFRDHLMSIRTISPVDGKCVCGEAHSRPRWAQIEQTLQAARALRAQAASGAKCRLPSERPSSGAFLRRIRARRGRSDRHCAQLADGTADTFFAPSEVRGTLEARPANMTSIAPTGARRYGSWTEGRAFRRFVRREPLGVVFTVGPPGTIRT